MMSLKKPVFQILKGLLIFIFGAIFPALISAQDSGQFDLAGYHLTDPVGTSATGMAEAVVEGDSLKISGHFQDLSSPYWSAYIHYGAVGETGNRLLTLHAEVSGDQTDGRFDPAVNTFQLSEAVRQALSDGKLYLLISSRRYRHGEIRGQIPALQND